MSDDDCREAVSSLNKLRMFRAENIGDGYDVSDTLCYDFYDATPTLPIQCLEDLAFAPTVKDALVKYVDGMMSVLLCPCGIFQNLTWRIAKHSRRIVTSQRGLGMRLRMPWAEQMALVSQ